MSHEQFTPEELALIERLRQAPQPALRPARRDALRQQVLMELEAVTAAPAPSAATPALPKFLLPAVISVVVILAIIGLVIVNSGDSESTTSTPTLTDPTDLPATADVIPATVEATPIPTLEVTAESTPDSTALPLASEEAAAPLLVIEGAITAMTANTLTIFDVNIQVDPAAPIWAELQVGETVRVEGESTFDGNVLIVIAVNITVVEMDVVIVDGAPVNNLPANCRYKSGKIKCSGGGRGSGRSS